MITYTQTEITSLKTMVIEHALKTVAKEKPATIELAIERIMEIYEFLAGDL